MKIFFVKKLLKSLSVLLIIFLFILYLLYYKTSYLFPLFEDKIKEVIYDSSDEITFIDYTSIDGNFHDYFIIQDLTVSISKKYTLNSDLIIRLESYKYIPKIISALIDRDYNSMKEFMKNNIYEFSRVSFSDSSLSYNSTISKLILRKNNLSLKEMEIKGENFNIEINNMNSFFSNYQYPNKVDIASIDFKINFIETLKEENRKVHIDSISLSSFEDENQGYLFNIFGINSLFSEEININNMSISIIDHHQNEENYIKINSLNNDIYIDNIKYNFNLNLKANHNYINVEYLDIFDNNKNIINFRGEIYLNDKTFTASVKTSDYNILGIKPQKSLINIISNDLEKYDIEFSMYKISGLVKKTLDKMNGKFILKCEDRICSDYSIIFNENIKIIDNHYKGEFELNNVKRMNDFKLQVKSSFIDILKKDKLDRVK